MKKLVAMAMLIAVAVACTEEKDCWTCRTSAYNKDYQMYHTVIQHYDCNFDAKQWGERSWSNGKAERISCTNSETGENLIWE